MVWRGGVWWCVVVCGGVGREQHPQRQGLHGIERWFPLFHPQGHLFYLVEQHFHQADLHRSSKMLQVYHTKGHLGSQFHKKGLSFPHPQHQERNLCARRPRKLKVQTHWQEERPFHRTPQQTLKQTPHQQKGQKRTSRIVLASCLGGHQGVVLSRCVTTSFATPGHEMCNLASQVPTSCPLHLSPTQAAKCTAFENRSEDVSCACVSFPMLGLVVFPCLQEQGSLNLSTCLVCLVSRDIPHAGKVFLYSPGQARECKIRSISICSIWFEYWMVCLADTFPNR